MCSVLGSGVAEPGYTLCMPEAGTQHQHHTNHHLKHHASNNPHTHHPRNRTQNNTKSPPFPTGEEWDHPPLRGRPRRPTPPHARKTKPPNPPPVGKAGFEVWVLTKGGLVSVHHCRLYCTVVHAHRVRAGTSFPRVRACIGMVRSPKANFPMPEAGTAVAGTPSPRYRHVWCAAVSVKTVSVKTQGVLPSLATPSSVSLDLPLLGLLCSHPRACWSPFWPSCCDLKRPLTCRTARTSGAGRCAPCRRRCACTQTCTRREPCRPSSRP